MTKSKKYLLFLSAMIVCAIAILPIIPIGEQTVSLNLSTGEEMIEKNYFGGLLKSQTVSPTPISEIWSRLMPYRTDAETQKMKLFLISKNQLFPFDKQCILLKNAKIYYDLVEQCTQHPDAAEKAITAFIDRVSSPGN